MATITLTTFLALLPYVATARKVVGVARVAVAIGKRVHS